MNLGEKDESHSIRMIIPASTRKKKKKKEREKATGKPEVKERANVELLEMKSRRLEKRREAKQNGQTLQTDRGGEMEKNVRLQGGQRNVGKRPHRKKSTANGLKKEKG